MARCKTSTNDSEVAKEAISFPKPHDIMNFVVCIAVPQTVEATRNSVRKPRTMAKVKERGNGSARAGRDRIAAERITHGRAAFTPAPQCFGNGLAMVGRPVRRHAGCRRWTGSSEGFGIGHGSMMPWAPGRQPADASRGSIRQAGHLRSKSLNGAANCWSEPISRC